MVKWQKKPDSEEGLRMVIFVWICVITLCLSIALNFIGDHLNKAVMKVNGGFMPVVRNHPDDTENFERYIRESGRHVWADENTKLVFLSDWINISAHPNAPLLLHDFFEKIKYPLHTPGKASIGDICLWTGFVLIYIAMAMFVIGIFAVFYIAMDEILFLERSVF